MVNAFNVAFNVAKKEWPFTDYPGLRTLHERTGSNIPQCYRNDKAIARQMYIICLNYG